MEHGTTLLAFLHIFVAVLLVTIILLQDGKGGGMGGAFGGGGGSQSLFGATGAANFLVKVTRTLAVLFVGTCIGLTLLISHRTNHSVIDSMPVGATSLPQTTTPATPTAPAAPAAAPGTAGATTGSSSTTTNSHP